MSFKSLTQFGPFRSVLYRLALWRVQEKLAEIIPKLNQTDRVLDIGAGNCVLCRQLRLAGYDVTPVDLENLSFINDIVPILYDGMILPFDDDSYDVAMVVTVLHHTQDPDAVLSQLKRVAKRIIVIEEIYEGSFEKYYTYFIDSLFNLEFFNHPRSNRTDNGWRTAFKQLGLEVESVIYSRSLGLRRVTYCLARA
jgi:ubiquinone/menaquinone biosynthesis C-methylase UbiE